MRPTSYDYGHSKNNRPILAVYCCSSYGQPLILTGHLACVQEVVARTRFHCSAAEEVQSI